jgi:hypothetical protein
MHTDDPTARSLADASEPDVGASAPAGGSKQDADPNPGASAPNEPTPEEVKRRVSAFVAEVTPERDLLVRAVLFNGLLWALADRVPGVVAEVLDESYLLLTRADVAAAIERGGL